MESAVLQGALATATFALSLKLTGDHTAETPWWRRLAGIGYGAFGLWLALLLMSGAVPVVKEMEARVLERGPTWVLMSVSAVKSASRKECVFEYTRAIVVDASGRTAKAWWESLDDPAPGATRPPGPQWMGDWRVRWDLTRFKPVAVIYESHHNCGWLGGDVVTTNGPFAINAQ